MAEHVSMTQVPNSSSIFKAFLSFLFSYSNKTITDVLEEFEDGGCLSDYDPNEVWGTKHYLPFSFFSQTTGLKGLGVNP